MGVDQNKGVFCFFILLFNDDLFNKQGVYNIEVFGFVSMFMFYKGFEEAIVLVNMGKGLFVSIVVIVDECIVIDYVMGVVVYYGCIFIFNEESVKESIGYGFFMFLLVYGGLGWVGGGEEMGGVWGVKYYLQCMAIQGYFMMIIVVMGQY